MLATEYTAIFLKGDFHALEKLSEKDLSFVLKQVMEDLPMIEIAENIETADIRILGVESKSKIIILLRRLRKGILSDDVQVYLGDTSVRGYLNQDRSLVARPKIRLFTDEDVNTVDSLQQAYAALDAMQKRCEDMIATEVQRGVEMTNSEGGTYVDIVYSKETTDLLYKVFNAHIAIFKFKMDVGIITRKPHQIQAQVTLRGDNTEYKKYLENITSTEELLTQVSKAVDSARSLQTPIELDDYEIVPDDSSEDGSAR